MAGRQSLAGTLAATAVELLTRQDRAPALCYVQQLIHLFLYEAASSIAPLLLLASIFQVVLKHLLPHVRQLFLHRSISDCYRKLELHVRSLPALPYPCSDITNDFMVSVPTV